MEDFADTSLWLTSLALPYLLFMVGNSFRKWKLVFLRAAVAIMCGWAYTVAYAVAINAINLSRARSHSDFETLFRNDGPAGAFASVLGWVLPAIIVGLAWFIHGFVVPRWFHRPNPSLKPDAQKRRAG